MQRDTHVFAAAISLLIVAATAAWFVAADDQDAERLGPVHHPAQDAIVQTVDLNKIESVQDIDDRTLTVVADGGRRFRMTLMDACPELRGATSVGFVTDGWHGLDRFTAIAVDGRVCTLKDFRPEG